MSCSPTSFFCKPLFFPLLCCCLLINNHFLISAGILKNVKDHIKDCAQCQSKRNTDDGSGPRLFSRPGKRKATVNTNEEEDDEEGEEEGDESIFFADSSSQQRSKLVKAKHELVFVSVTHLKVD